MLDEVYKCTGWSSFGGTSDYFNSCDTFYVDVPQNIFGYQVPMSGNAYCGLGSYNPQGLREYIGSQLIDSLQVNTKYFVSFFANLPNVYGGCLSNKIGVKFSKIPYSASSPPSQNNFAHLFSQNFIADTMNWTKIAGSFIADSNYHYVIIGNFFDNANTDTLNCGPAGSDTYLYIDQVCVSTDSLLCNGINSISESAANLQINIYPNPAKENFFIESKEPFMINEIVIINLLTQSLKCNLKKIKNNKYEVSLPDLSKGIYFVSIAYNNQKYLTKKIIIN